MTFLHLTYVEMKRSIHRRVVWWMVALAVFGCLFTGFVVWNTSRNPEFGFLEPSHPANMVNWKFGGLNGGFLGVAAGFLALGAAICGASVAGAEWRAGTITTVLTWSPSRWRLHGARTLAAAIWSFVVAIALQIVFLLACYPAAVTNGSTDVPDGYWTGLGGDIVRIAFVTALVAVLAFSIATIGRNTTPALIVIAGWALIGEPLVSGFISSVQRWLITPNVVLVVVWGNGDDDEFGFTRGPGVALATLVFYVAVFAAVAFGSFKRDIAGTS